MSVFYNEHYSCPATFIWIFYNRQDPFWKGRLQQREQQSCLLEVRMKGEGREFGGFGGGGGVCFPRFLALGKQDGTFPGQETSQETDAQNKPKQNKMTGKPSNLLSSLATLEKEGSFPPQRKRAIFFTPKPAANFPSPFWARKSQRTCEPGGRAVPLCPAPLRSASPAAPASPGAALAPALTRIANALREM